MKLLRHAVHRTVVNAVLAVAPLQRLPVQIGNITEHTINEEVFLHKTDEALYLALRERMPRLAELCLEAHGLHECLIILLPHRMPFHVPVKDYALHVVCEDKSRNAHILKGVDHADEEVFLPGIGKELHVPLPAMMADHSEAGHLKLGSVWIQNLCEAPIHLKCFPRLGRVTATAVALRRDLLPLGRQEMLVRGDVTFDGTTAPGEAHFLKTFQAYSGIADAATEHAVENGRIAIQNLRPLLTCEAVRHFAKAICFQAAKLRTAQACPTAQLGQIDLIDAFEFAMCFFHFRNGLCYNGHEAIAV